MTRHIRINGDRLPLRDDVEVEDDDDVVRDGEVVRVGRMMVSDGRGGLVEVPARKLRDHMRSLDVAVARGGTQLRIADQEERR